MERLVLVLAVAGVVGCSGSFVVEPTVDFAMIEEDPYLSPFPDGDERNDEPVGRLTGGVGFSVFHDTGLEENELVDLIHATFNLGMVPYKIRCSSDHVRVSGQKIVGTYLLGASLNYTSRLTSLTLSGNNDEPELELNTIDLRDATFTYANKGRLDIQINEDCPDKISQGLTGFADVVANYEPDSS